MCREKRKSATAYLATAVVLACYLAHTVDCYRLTKTGRREWPKEVDAAKTVGVQEGKIVFGSVSNNGSHLESQDMDGATKASSSPHVEDGTAYQADFAGKNVAFVNYLLLSKLSKVSVNGTTTDQVTQNF